VTSSDFLRDTRAGYDAIAVDYADRYRDVYRGKPPHRALLGAFAELVTGPDTGSGARPVADIGSGPGLITAHLDGLGVPVLGIDLSPRMVELARATYPGLRFEVGSMTGLDAPDGRFAGIVAMYSIIHIPEPVLPKVFAEFRRVLAPGGQLLVAFQVGDEPLSFTEAFGHRVALDFRRLRPERIEQLLGEAGLFTHTRMVCDPDTASGETTPQAYLMARKPPATDHAPSRSAPDPEGTA